MPSLNLTTDELNTIQNVLYLIQAFSLAFSALSKSDGDAITGLENKITAFIGDPYTMMKRTSVEADIKNFFADDQEVLSSSLAELDRLYPLPEALRR